MAEPPQPALPVGDVSLRPRGTVAKPTPRDDPEPAAAPRRRTAAAGLLNRRIVRAKFAGPLWWTVDDMARRLEDAVPAELASRAYAEERPRKAATLPAADLVHAGRRFLLIKILIDMIARGHVAVKVENSRKYYRVKEAARPAPRKTDRLAPDAFTRPDPNNRAGVSVQMCRTLVAQNPGITPQELVKKLALCFIDAGCMDAAIKRGQKAVRRNAKSPFTLAEAKLMVVQNRLTTLTTDGSVRPERVVRYYPVAADESPPAEDDEDDEDCISVSAGGDDAETDEE